MNSKLNILPVCIYRFALVLLFSFLFLSLSEAKSFTLGWNPNEEPDLEGYVVYRNIASRGPPYQYSDDLTKKNLADPHNPKVTLTGLEENTKYYIALTAYDTARNESEYSNDICVQIVDSVPEVCSSSTSKKSSGVGGGGGGCFIMVTNLKTACPIVGPFFLTQLAGTFFAVLFLILIGAAKLV